VELRRSQVPRSLITVEINFGFEEETSRNESTNKGVNNLKIRLVNLVKISKWLVNNPERENLVMGVTYRPKICFFLLSNSSLVRSPLSKRAANFSSCSTSERPELELPVVLLAKHSRNNSTNRGP